MLFTTVQRIAATLYSPRELTLHRRIGRRLFSPVLVRSSHTKTRSWRDITFFPDLVLSGRPFTRKAYPISASGATHHRGIRCSISSEDPHKSILLLPNRPRGDLLSLRQNVAALDLRMSQEKGAL